jgi:predicted O-methyltransferase YrrM
VRNVGNRQFVKQLAQLSLAADVRTSPALPPLPPEVEFLDAYPEAAGMTVPMGDVTYKVWNMDPMERFCLAVVAQLKEALRIFEFGTFDGATSLLLAKAAPTAQVFTIDLPPESYSAPQDFGYPASPGEYESAHDEVGHEFRDTPEGERITQLFGDTTTFDFSEYVGTMDLVIVDAGHGYEAARSDTENALQLAGPSGVVIWDDFIPQWPGVMQAVMEAADRHGLPVFRVRGTGFVVYDPSRTG